jgi:hypothetical protein
MEKLEKGYTAEQLNTFMQAIHKSGKKARRTADGGWEVIVPVPEQPKPERTRPTREKPVIRQEKPVTVLPSTVEQVAPETPEVESKIESKKRGFWSRLLGQKPDNE